MTKNFIINFLNKNKFLILLIMLFIIPFVILTYNIKIKNVKSYKNISAHDNNEIIDAINQYSNGNLYEARILFKNNENENNENGLINSFLLIIPIIENYLQGEWKTTAQEIIEINGIHEATINNTKALLKNVEMMPCEYCNNYDLLLSIYNECMHQYFDE